VRAEERPWLSSVAAVEGERVVAAERQASRDLTVVPTREASAHWLTAPVAGVVVASCQNASAWS
jgi:hypothetical protein